MSEISDELRKIAERYHDWWIKPYKGPNDLADRIDAEMVELPRDKDGVPIHVGDMLRGCDAVLVNVFTIVEELRFDGRWEIDTTFGCITAPRLFVHDSPDSLERIAEEIEKADVDGCTDWADRIRKLAKEREHE